MRGKLKKRTITILCVFAALIAALVVLLTIVCQSKRLFEGENSSEKYEYVMSDIEGIVEANPRVSDIAMLGSHDANTYNIDVKNSLSGETKDGVKILRDLAPGVFYRYSKTQTDDIYTQLTKGVRYLHIKCSYKGGEWYGSHTILCGKLDVYVKQAIKFLACHPGEIVILTFQIMYAENSTAAEFCDYVYGGIEYEGLTLSDFMPFENLYYREITYNQLTLNGTQAGALIMLEGKDDEFERGEFFKNIYDSKYKAKLSTEYHYLSATWHNTMKAKTMAEKLDAKCEQMDVEKEKYEGYFRVMQINTTPNAKDVFSTAFAWSLMAKAKKHNIEMLEHPNFDKWMKYMPIVQCDFSTSENDDFNRRINAKIREYNTKLIENMTAQNL